MICVSLAEKNVALFLSRIEECFSPADMFEFRLDALGDLESSLDKFLPKSPLPFIVTNRPSWEGGNFQGPESDRLDILKEAVELGADYVDIEVRTDSALRSAFIQDISGKGAQIILSFHDFEKTPPIKELKTILDMQIDGGAAIGKIVTMANSQHDIARLFSLYEYAWDLNFRLLAFCMGTIGKASRVAALSVGAPWMYVSPSDGKETAPGQLNISEAYSILKILNINS